MSTVAGDYTPKELADELRVSEGTLANWRHKGTGPTYYKVGALVRYPATAVAEYKRAHTVEPVEK